MGPFDSLSFDLVTANDAIAKLWDPPLASGATAMTIKFIYYSLWDAFKFEQAIAPGCASGLNMTSLPPNASLSPELAHMANRAERASNGSSQLNDRLGESQYQSIAVTSTGFPCFDASAGSALRSTDVGYLMWRGTFSDMGLSHGQGLSEWIGGTETGPTVFYTAKDAGDALVLSASDDFFHATVGQASCRQAGDDSIMESSAPRTGRPSNPMQSDAQCTIVKNTDFQGNDLGSVVVNSSGACCDACVENMQCVCWTFDGDVPG